MHSSRKVTAGQLNKQRLSSSNSYPKYNGKYFVFLDLHMLMEGVSSVSSAQSSSAQSSIQIAEGGDESAAETKAGAFWHSEVLLCDRSQFSKADVSIFEKQLQSVWYYKEIEKSFWKNVARGEARCIKLGFGGTGLKQSCSGVFSHSQKFYEGKAGIADVDSNEVYRYIYGTTDLDPSQARDEFCAGSCGMDWAGVEYGAVARNCNYFSATLLFCIFNLHQHLPPVGLSHMKLIFACPRCRNFPVGQSIQLREPGHYSKDGNEVQLDKGSKCKVLAVKETDGYLNSEVSLRVDCGDSTIFWVTPTHLAGRTHFDLFKKRFVVGNVVRLVTGGFADQSFMGLTGGVIESDDETEHALVDFGNGVKERIYYDYLILVQA